MCVGCAFIFILIFFELIVGRVYCLFSVPRLFALSNREKMGYKKSGVGKCKKSVWRSKKNNTHLLHTLQLMKKTPYRRSEKKNLI